MTKVESYDQNARNKIASDNAHRVLGEVLELISRRQYSGTAGISISAHRGRITSVRRRFDESVEIE